MVYSYSRTIFVLTFLVFFCWIVIFQIPDSKVHVIACDVGQGDGVLIVYKNFQVLTDGGPPNGKLEKCLSNYLPFWDRQIEVVVNTHPQLDHFGGLINVFKNYKVETFIENKINVSTQEYKLLEKWVGTNGARIVNPNTHPSIRLGLMQYDVFYPSGEVLDLFKKDNTRDANDLSIQSLVKYGEFTALLTGDIGENMSYEVLKNFPKESVDYIKIPHHGSKNGMVESYLREIMPKVAVISSGKNNSYGHPHKAILDLLKNKNIKILRTDEMGNVEIVTDGKKIWVKNY